MSEQVIKPVDADTMQIDKVDAPKRTKEQQAEFDRMRRELLFEVKEEVEKRLRISSTEKRDVFLSLLLLKCEITMGELAPTACVRLSRTGQPLIQVNPEFWLKLENSQIRYAVLVHELYHVVMEHFSRFDYTKENPVLLNIAMDCAINQLIVPFNGDTKVGDTKPINYHTFVELIRKIDQNNVIGAIDERETAEYYLRILKKALKGNGGGEGNNGNSGGAMSKIKGSVTSDADGSGKILVNDHSQSQQDSEETDSLSREMFKDQIRRTMYQAGVTHGSELGLDLEERKKVNWKQILRHFINRAVKTDATKTKNRPNRRYGYVAAKRIKDKKTEIDVLCDTSGSMSYVLPIVFSELLNLANETADFSLWSVDTELTNCGKIRTKNDLKNIKVPQGGGTCFETALPELSKRKQKRPVIFITDTYGEFPAHSPNYPMIILTTEERIYDGMPDWARRKSLDISSLMKRDDE